MKEIKDFIEMIEIDMQEQRKAANKFYEDMFQEGAAEAYEDIVESDQYQALKSCIDKPMPKMKVTEEIFDIAIEAYSRIYNETNGSYRKAVKAALEAVFAFMPVSEDKEYCPRMDLCHKSMNEIIRELPDYDFNKYQKPSVRHCLVCGKSPLLKPEQPINIQDEDRLVMTPIDKILLEQIKDIKERNQFYNEHFTDLAQMMADHLKPETIIELEQLTDTQDNDEWIKHDGSECIPDLYDIKLRSGTILQNSSKEGWWHWAWRNHKDDVVAYRIIDEPKEKEKRPKKQTLFEFALKYVEQTDGSIKSLTNLGLIEMLNDYLIYLEKE